MIILRSLEQLQNLVAEAFGKEYDENSAQKIANFVVYGTGDSKEIFELAKSKRQAEFDKNIFGGFANVPINIFCHFFASFNRESQAKNFLGGSLFACENIGNAVGYGKGFSRPCDSKKNNIICEVVDYLKLFVVGYSIHRNSIA